MTFKKINENTIRCVLTEDDMEENDIGLEDFFSSNREKIHSFLETIMDEARREIGYENDGSVLSMQLMPLPKNGLAITITGTEENDLGEMLGSVQNMLKSMRDSLSEEEDIIGDEDTAGYEENGAEENRDAASPAACRIFVFDSLSDVERYCKAVCGYAKNLKTSLYKAPEGGYYMEISKGRGSKSNYEAACIEALEYAKEENNSPLFINYMQEHFDRLVARRVIENIR